MTDTLIIKGSPVAQHEAQYDHSLIGTGGDATVDPSFGAGLYLPFTETPTAGVTLENAGYWGSDADLFVVGSWAKTTTDGGGNYYQKGDANNGGFRHKAVFDSDSTGASFSSISSTQIVVDSTATDLQALFQHVGHANLRRKYKLIVRSTSGGNKAQAGYIGEVAKSTNRYTITVYATPDGTSAGWAGYDGGLTSPSYWGIYRACFDYVKGSATRVEGMSFAFFWYPSDITGNNIHIFTHWGSFVDANKCQQWALYQTATDGQLQLIWKDASNTTSAITLTCETASQWHGIVCTVSNSEYLYSAGECSLSINGHHLFGQAADKNPGMLCASPAAIGCAPLGDDTNIVPNGSRYAYPTFWDYVISHDTKKAWHNHHAGLLGI